jgi:hypothetical protein
MNDYINNFEHIGIYGITGSSSDTAGYGGKSVLANWWFTETVQNGHFDYGLFFNASHLDYVRGEKAYSYVDCANIMEKGGNLINFLPESATGETEHHDLMEFLRDLNGTKIVVTDEATDLDKEGGSLHKAVKRYGNQGNMKNLVIAQSPSDLENHIRKQCTKEIWVGPFSEDEKFLFRQKSKKHMKVVRHLRENHDPFQWTVWDKMGNIVDYNNPVSDKYAK